MVASIISLGFLVTHAHCYPFKDTSLNMLKLSSEVVIIIVFLMTALLRSVDTKTGQSSCHAPLFIYNTTLQGHVA